AYLVDYRGALGRADAPGRMIPPGQGGAAVTSQASGSAADLVQPPETPSDARFSIASPPALPATVSG
ncbi:MAG TPA: hypothetical protein VN541_19230, partial [Tepidisphaeraceae bacterium]|nr:hypothetical protein [Tepidisphaeraceae bacterium]